MQHRRLLISGVLPLALLAFCAGAASRGWCDTTLITEIRTTRVPGGPSRNSAAEPDAGQAPVPQVTTATISFKGRLARFESTNGTVRIYDGVKGRIYTLNAADRSYRVSSAKEAGKVSDPVLQLPGVADIDTQLKLTKTDATQTQAGQSVQRYDCIATLQPRAPETPDRMLSGGRAGRGGRRGRGGFPGGGLDFSQRPGDYSGRDDLQGRNYPGGRSRPQSSIQVAGELYLSGSALLPDGNRWTAGALIESMIPWSPLTRVCVDRVNHLKMIPLASNLTFNYRTPGQPGDTLSIVTQVKSISDAPLEDALFVVPADYHMSAAE